MFAATAQKLNRLPLRKYASCLTSVGMPGLCLLFEVIYTFFLAGFGILISSTQKLTRPTYGCFDGSH